MYSNGIRASVAMAVFNGERYICEQLDSILKMMGDDDEVIISYEDSNDRTLDIIKDYEQNDRRVHVVFDEGHSVESNFNNAVANCRGDYIFLSDQDDIWINDKINKMVEVFEENPDVVVLISDGFQVDNNLNIINEIFETYHTTTNPIRNYVQGTYLGCQMAFKRTILEKVWPINVTPPLPHDLWLGIQGSKYGKVMLVNDKMIYHRLHDENYSNTSKMSFPQLIKERILFLTELMKRN